MSCRTCTGVHRVNRRARMCLTALPARIRAITQELRTSVTSLCLKSWQTSKIIGLIFCHCKLAQIHWGYWNFTNLHPQKILWPFFYPVWIILLATWEHYYCFYDHLCRIKVVTQFWSHTILEPSWIFLWHACQIIVEFSQEPQTMLWHYMSVVWNLM